MNHEPADPWALIVGVMTLFVSREIAEIVSPYIWIIFAAFAGAFISLSGGPRLGAMRSTIYIGLRIFIACTLAVSLAELLQLAFSAIKPRYSLSILSFAIGLVSDYNKVRNWVVNLFKSWLENRYPGKGKGS